MLVGIEMPWKNIAKIAAALAEATAKGFYRAVRQELNASKEAAARQAAAGQAASTSRSQRSEQQRAMETNARLGITLRESMQILDVKEPLKAEEIKQRYEHLFAVNEKSKGGTIYLQAKIYRAKERLDNELERIEKERKEKEENAMESAEEVKIERK